MLEIIYERMPERGEYVCQVCNNVVQTQELCNARLKGMEDADLLYLVENRVCSGPCREALTMAVNEINSDPLLERSVYRVQESVRDHANLPNIEDYLYQFYGDNMGSKTLLKLRDMRNYILQYRQQVWETSMAPKCGACTFWTGGSCHYVPAKVEHHVLRGKSESYDHSGSTLFRHAHFTGESREADTLMRTDSRSTATYYTLPCRHYEDKRDMSQAPLKPTMENLKLPHRWEASERIEQHLFKVDKPLTTGEGGF